MRPFERIQLLSKVRFEHAECGDDLETCPRKQEHVLIEQNDAVQGLVLSAISEMESFRNDYIGIIHDLTSDRGWIAHIDAWVEHARQKLEHP